MLIDNLKNIDHEMRVKRIRVPMRSLICLLGMQDEAPACVTLVDWGIPRGAKIICTREDQLGMCYDVYLTHPDFGQVSPYADVPYLDNEPVWRQYLLATEEEVARRCEPTERPMTIADPVATGKWWDIKVKDLHDAIPYEQVDSFQSDPVIVERKK